MNDFTRLTPEQGFRVHGWMRTLFDLTGTELLIFAIVYSYTGKGGAVGGIRFFTEWTGVTRPTVINSLQKLEQSGLITVTETGNGKLKKYTVSEAANKRIEVVQNDVEPVKNFNQSNNLTSKESLPPPVKNFNPHQSNFETGTSKDFLPATKLYRKQESKLERKPDNTTLAINSTPREELPPIAERAMIPPEAPAFHEVYTTMESLTIRPSGTELERCVRAFYDREERQGWRGNWKGKVQSYAASWLNNLNRHSGYRQPPREQARGCQPDDPPMDYGEIPW